MKRVPAPKAAGFTLIEMSITLVLMALALALVSRLLLDSQHLFLRAGREVDHVDASVLGRRIRLDIQAASGVATPSGPLLPGVWNAEALLLTRSDGGVLAYETQGAELKRYTFDGSGKLLTERRVALGIRSWRWRLAAPGLVDIEIDREDPTKRTQRLRLALRGMPRSNGW